jgi:hypothetical protein
MPTPIGAVEIGMRYLITDYYATVQLEPELRQHIEASLTDELQSPAPRQQHSTAN